MAKPNRMPLQVSPEFKRKLDEIQKKIMKTQGEKRSLREITEEIISSPLFREIENKIVKSDNGIKAEIKIRFDRRIL